MSPAPAPRIPSRRLRSSRRWPLPRSSPGPARAIRHSSPDRPDRNYREYPRPAASASAAGITRPRGARRGRRADREARQDVAAVERLVLADQASIGGRCMDPGRALPGIDHPGQADPGVEVFAPACAGSPPGYCSSLMISMARSGIRSGIGFSGTFRPGSLSHEMKERSGIRTSPARSGARQSGPTTDPPVGFRSRYSLSKPPSNQEILGFGDSHGFSTRVPSTSSQRRPLAPVAA